MNGDINQLEQFVNTINWGAVSMEPDPTEVALIEQEYGMQLEAEIEQEIIEPLLSDVQHIDEKLDIPEGNIVRNANESLDHLAINIDELIEELDQEMQELDHYYSQEYTEHDDFGR
jgi:hypothetical protein